MATAGARGASTRSRRHYGRRRLAGSWSVDVRAVTLGWAGSAVVSGLDLDGPPGRSLGVVGPSGSGKSTLAENVRLARPGPPMLSS